MFTRNEALLILIKSAPKISSHVFLFPCLHVSAGEVGHHCSSGSYQSRDWHFRQGAEDIMDYLTLYDMQSEQGVHRYKSTAEGMRQRVAVVMIKPEPWGVME